MLKCMLTAQQCMRRDRSRNFKRWGAAEFSLGGNHLLGHLYQFLKKPDLPLQCTWYGIGRTGPVGVSVAQ